jgi:putative CocE/NonD family hydrolase
MSPKPARTQPISTRVRRRAPARGLGLLAALALGGAALAAPAGATTPAPPPGSPAVESAPPSLVGTSPTLPSSVIAASAARGSHWTPEKAIYGTASRNDVPVRGAGGTTIRVNEIYPTLADGRPAPGRFPVLLTMTPYGKGQGGSSAPGSAQTSSGGAATGGADNYLVQRGYIEVVEDVRGTGDSGGSFGLFDPIQTQDAIRVLHWAARLPHSDGRVGTYGPSYLGIDQFLLAGAVGRHSPLKAIFPMVPANDIYRDTSFMGGLLDFEFSEAYLGLTTTLNQTTPITDTASDPTLLGDLASIEADHANSIASYVAALTLNVMGGGSDAYDESYWLARSPVTYLRRVVANAIPAYMVGGEFDIFQHGEPLDYAALQNAWDRRSVNGPMAPGQRVTGRYQLIDGPWEHINGSSVNVDPLELEWFDTWLKHERTGMARTRTPLHYYDLGTGRFDETTTFPFTGGVPTRLYLGSGGTLASTAPPATPGSGGLPGRTGGLPIIGAAPKLPLDSGHALSPGVPSAAAPSDTLVWSPIGSICGRPIDQWSMGAISIPAHEAGLLAPCADDDRSTQLGPWATTYTTAPFTRAEAVAGPITATIYARSTTPETELIAELEDVTPSGASYPLTEGALLGSLRAVDAARSWSAGGMTLLPYHPYTQASQQPVVPGQVTKYEVEIFPTLATIAAGDRLRLTLSTTDAPHLVPIPGELSKLAGGVYTVEHTAAAPSALTMELRAP